MAGLKEIDRRIKSSKNTQKTTYAMKLVSAAKLKKSQDTVIKGRSYFNSLIELMGELIVEKDALNLNHPLTETKEDFKKVRLIVVGASKGLCGAYNSNVYKKISSTMEDFKARGLEVDSILLGKKPVEYYERMNFSYSNSFTKLSDKPSEWPIEEVSLQAQHDFKNGKIGEVWVLYTYFKSALSMDVECKRILPLSAKDLSDKASDTSPGMTKFEPTPAAVFNAVMPRIVTGFLRQACLSSKTAEHGSRMTAMESATKNAGELINSLRRTYNKLRQEAITAELLDIVGGAEAVK